MKRPLQVFALAVGFVAIVFLLAVAMRSFGLFADSPGLALAVSTLGFGALCEQMFRTTQEWDNEEESD